MRSLHVSLDEKVARRFCRVALVIAKDDPARWVSATEVWAKARATKDTKSKQLALDFAIGAGWIETRGRPAESIRVVVSIATLNTITHGTPEGVLASSPRKA